MLRRLSREGSDVERDNVGGDLVAKRYDLAIIGTGTAAIVTAHRVRAAGWSVAVADFRPFGGTCALRGCDPKKMMVGGAEDHFAAALPVMECYGARVVRMGEAGSGQLAKMVNQICIAGLVQGLAEALNFAQCAGLDGQAVVDVISKGAAQSWQMENRYKTMLAGEFDFGFAVDWMRKDLSILLEESRRNGAQLPVTALVDQFYADVQAMGGGRWDTSSLLARLQRNR